MNLSFEQKLSFTIEQAVKATGIGRTTIFAAIKSGRLVARKNGRRTLIASGDLQKFLASLPVVSRDVLPGRSTDV